MSPARRRVVVGVATGLLLAAAILSAPESVGGAPRCSLTWVGAATGSWTTTANWQPARVPQPESSVCLPDDRAVEVTLGTSTTVRSFTTGASTLALAAGVTLTTKHLDVTGPGGLRGPGTVLVPAGARNSVDLGGPDRPRLDGRVHLQATSTYARLSGRVWLGDGSVVTLRGTTIPNDGFAVDGDGGPGTLWDAGSLGCYAADVSSFAVPVRVTRAFISFCDLSVPYLVGARPDGTIDLSHFEVEYSTLLVPYPVASIVGTEFLSLHDATIAVASTGLPALSGLRRWRLQGYVERSTVHTDVPLAVDVPGSPSSLTLDSARLEAPTVTVAPGTSLGLYYRSVVQLSSDATGDLILGSTASPRSVLVGGGARIAGDLVQRNGEVHLTGSSRVTGSWTSSSSALHSFQVFLSGSTPTDVVVDGTADLRGSLVLAKPDGTPTTGYRQILVRATGGLRASFSHVTLPAHWKLSTTPTTLVATYTG